MGWWLSICVGRHAGRGSCIQGSTRNRGNEWTTDNHRSILATVYVALCVYCTLCSLHSVYTSLGVWFTRCMMHLVYAALGVCCTWCMLHLVYATTRCKLMIMAWRYSEGWLKFVFCIDGRVMDWKEGDVGKRRARYGYEWIWVIRSTTCPIGVTRPRFSVNTCRIATRTCWIGLGMLTHTRNSLKSQFLMMISPISSHFSLSCPQLYDHLRTPS